MSLLRKYGDFNKYTQTGLCIRYSMAEQNGLYLVTRYATKDYFYVGMTYETAQACAAAKREQYMRKHNQASIVAKTSTVAQEDGTEKTATTYEIEDTKLYESLCSISVNHGEGDSWDVEIQVNEEETRGTKSSSTSPDSLFSTENVWEYDEATDVSQTTFELMSAAGAVGETTISVNITTSDESFSPGGATLSVSFGTTTATYTCSNASHGAATGTWHLTFGGATALEDAATTVKVVYGATTSNAVTFNPATFTTT